MNKIDKMALEAFPERYKNNYKGFSVYDKNSQYRKAYKKGCEDMLKNILVIVRERIKKTSELMDQSVDDEQEIYSFWDGSNNELLVLEGEIQSYNEQEKN